MKNIILNIALLTLSFSTFAQIGVNTSVPDPSAALDVESTTLGFLPPRMTETEMNNINTPAEGLIVYCTDCAKGLNFFDGSDWKAIGGSEAAPSVSADCDTNGFVGSYVSGEGLSGGSFSVNITNNSFSTAEISFGTSDLVLSGVSGLSVGTPTPSTATLSAGQSQIITYPLSGTPASTGTLTANWSKLSLSCVKEKVVSNGDASFSLPLDKYIISLDITSPNPVQIQGTIDNSTNTLSIDVPYTNGTGSYDAFTSNWFSVSGEGGDSNNIRYSYPSGTFSSMGVINITFEVDGDTSFLVEKQSPGIVALINSLDFTVNGDTKGAVNLNAVGGILDTNFMALQNGASFGNGANSPSDIVPQSDYGHTPYNTNFGAITQSYRAGGYFITMMVLPKLGLQKTIEMQPLGMPPINLIQTVPILWLISDKNGCSIPFLPIRPQQTEGLQPLRSQLLIALCTGPMRVGMLSSPLFRMRLVVVQTLRVIKLHFQFKFQDMSAIVLLTVAHVQELL
jgi:hypothetical protein